MKCICIVIPAYNEQGRIENTITSYVSFFGSDVLADRYTVSFLVVLNGCTDNTPRIVRRLSNDYGFVRLMFADCKGKGLALRTGFQEAFEFYYDYIGFVDADMATMPSEFCALIEALDEAVGECDGVIASRYMPGARTIPERPPIKRWGCALVYEPLVRLLFGLYYYDYQCGAKLFTRSTLRAVLPHLTVDQWGFDVEILYWCKRLKFVIKEIPTTWHDRAGSKLSIFGAGLPMLWALFTLRWRIWWGK